MLAFLSWYLIVTLIGLAAFPIAYRLLPALPDRGYSLSRALGLLLWGYLFWLPSSLGILGNDLTGQIFALTALLALSALTLRNGKAAAVLSWLQTKRLLIVRMEILFLLAFAGMAGVRAANPALNYTEKPMELAFINAILRSPSMPPQDPWLSGYAISYYYFGYILVAMLARLSGIWGSVAHNLGTALVFGLGALGAYGAVYNLLAVRRKQDVRPIPENRRDEPARSAQPDARRSLSDSVLALFGPLFVLVISNLEGLLEILHARHLFWQTGAEGRPVSGFWSWLDILDLNQPPVASPSWLPRGFGTGNWWWWRASRVLSDYNFSFERKEIIDEFPFFAFLHADLHPHVLAIPFAFLAIGIAFNLYLGGGGEALHLMGSGLKWQLSKLSFLLSAVILGSMFLLNAWDFPIYVALVAGAYAVGRLKADASQTGYEEQEEAKIYKLNARFSRFLHKPSSFLFDFLSLGLALGLAGIVLYLPFYLGFSSQAGGVIPSLVYFTRGAHLWVMFGSLLLPLGIYLLYLWHAYGNITRWFRGLVIVVGIVLGLWALSLLIASLTVLLGSIAHPSVNAPLVSEFGAPDWPSLLRASILRRLAAPGGWLTLTLLLSATLGLLFMVGKPTEDNPANKAGESEEGEEAIDSVPLPATGSRGSHTEWPYAVPYVLLLILLGILLVLGPEFFYLRDLFGYRINTIFKFYFQAWLLWGIATAYGSAVLWQSLGGKWAIVYRAGLVIVTGAALIYTFFGVLDKTDGFNPRAGWTLDGGAYLESQSPDELAAIRWLQNAPMGVMVEAVCPGGGSYLSECARLSTFSGLPTVMGWVWHEIQWRGSDQLFRTRQGDVERLYTTRDWREAQEILDQYNIRYVVVGRREREVYRLSEKKFEQALKSVFRRGEFVIYEVPR